MVSKPRRPRLEYVNLSTAIRNPSVTSIKKKEKTYDIAYVIA